MISARRSADSRWTRASEGHRYTTGYARPVTWIYLTRGALILSCDLDVGYRPVRHSVHSGRSALSRLNLTVAVAAAAGAVARGSGGELAVRSVRVLDRALLSVSPHLRYANVHQQSRTTPLNAETTIRHVKTRCRNTVAVRSSTNDCSLKRVRTSQHFT